MRWSVRSAGPLDAAAIQAVATAAWRDTYAGLLRPATIEAFLAGPYSIEKILRRIAGDEFLVAEGDAEGDAEGGIVAYADAMPEPERILLAAIYVLPERRSQGAGTTLLAVIAAGHPELPIDADVLVGNSNAEGFYERRGFQPIETLEGDLFGEPVMERRWRRPPLAMLSERL